MYSLLPLYSSLNTNEPSFIYLNNQPCLFKCRQPLMPLLCFFKETFAQQTYVATLVLTSAGKDIQSTVLMKMNCLPNFPEIFQRAVSQHEDQSFQGCPQKNGVLLSYYLITFAISLWIVVIGNSGVKYITCNHSDGKSTINHRCSALLLMIIINGKCIAI